MILHKRPSTALGTSPPESIVTAERTDRLKPTVEVNGVDHNEIQDWHMQIERHMKVGHEDTKQRTPDWRPEVKIDVKVGVYGDKFIGMLTKSESQVNGHLSRKIVGNHRTALQSDEVRPYTAYHAELGLKHVSLKNRRSTRF